MFSRTRCKITNCARTQQLLPPFSSPTAALFDLCQNVKSNREISPDNYQKTLVSLPFLMKKPATTNDYNALFIAFVFEKSLQIFVNFSIHSRKEICKESLLSRFSTFTFWGQNCHLWLLRVSFVVFDLVICGI